MLSYFHPVLLRREKGRVNPLLELYLYRNQLQLATFDALYSDGDRYQPVIAAVKRMKDKLPSVKNVLVLGTGLGSTVRIINKAGVYPHFTLVDNDETVLQWAIEFLPSNQPENITPICTDAKEFVANCGEQYDLVVIDIFSGRVVPGFVTEEAFLSQCRALVAPGGMLMLNYIVNNKENWEQASAHIAHLFPTSKVINLGINRVVVATV